MTGERSGPPPTRGGHEYGEVISTLQKALRRGSEQLALTAAVELDESGYGAACFRRLLIIAVEDHGLAEPGIVADIDAAHSVWLKLRAKRDDQARAWRLPYVYAVLRLARAKKSRLVDSALLAFYDDPQSLVIPDVARDRHTVAGRRMGRGAEHFFNEASLLIDWETGELMHEPVIEDIYRDRAMAAGRRGGR